MERLRIDSLALLVFVFVDELLLCCSVYDGDASERQPHKGEVSHDHPTATSRTQSVHASECFFLLIGLHRDQHRD